MDRRMSLIGTVIISLALGAVAAGLHAGSASAGKGSSCAASCTSPPASAEEKQLVGKVMETVKREGSIENALAGRSPEQFIKDLGFDASRFDLAHVRKLVEAELEASGCKVTSRCTSYGACSLVGDLATAKGDDLVRFRQEKKEDGRSFTDTMAPPWELESLQGKKVSLTGLRGRRVALMIWGTHCSHSLESLGAYDQVRKGLAPGGLEVLSVVVADKLTPQLRAWIPTFSKDLPVLVADPSQIAGYRTELLPTLYLIDEAGKLQQKFVGQKTPAELEQIVARFSQEGKPVPVPPAAASID